MMVQKIKDLVKTGFNKSLLLYLQKHAHNGKSICDLQLTLSFHPLHPTHVHK